MQRILRAGVVVLIVTTAAVAVFLTAAYRATQDVPEFYERALAKRPVEQKAAADQLERKVLQLHNEIRRSGRWEARFSQEQINGWLAADLPEKFPGALPSGVSEPRVAIAPDKMQLAIRYRQRDVNTVLSLSGDAYLTDRPNEVAIHIQHVRAGAFPVPLGQFLEKIALRATDAGLPLRWSEQEDGDPVALITLPLDREEFRGKQLQVENLEICEGEIVVSGRTDEPATKTAQQPETGGDQVEASETHQR
ncbi:MAG: hypothetical protein WD872_17580 [Pirellulaceae bacterium]